jgi:dTDP-4-amino-4,6-dideoxygalactose transaminase
MFEVVPPQIERPDRFLSLCPKFSSALVLVQLDRLAWNLGRRRKIAQMYREALSDLPGLSLLDIPDDRSPAWIQFPVLAKDKLAFYKHMQRHGVDVTWTYRYSCADSYGQNGYPNARQAAGTVLGLPVYPSLSDDEVLSICDAAKKYIVTAQMGRTHLGAPTPKPDEPFNT